MLKTSGKEVFLTFGSLIVDVVGSLLGALTILKDKVEKLKEDEWMYSSLDTLYKRS